MSKTKKAFGKSVAFLLALALCFSLFISARAFAGEVADEDAVEQQDESNLALVEGASFELVDQDQATVTDSDFTPEGDFSFWLYSPSNPHEFDMTSGQLNGTIFLYPDEPYASQEEAYAALEDLGLIDIAEKTPAYIIIPNPLNGESYTEDDLNVYYESQIYLAGGKIISDAPPTGEFDRHVFNNLLYVIAEGSGSTFVNNVLSQNANRIAGILTFGGEMDDEITEGVAVPAYLVNADDKAVDYYKAVNEVDTGSDDYFYNSDYEEKQVYVEEGGDSFDREVIEEAWNSMLSFLARLPMATNTVIDTMDMSEWVLMTWPNYDELGLTVVEHTYNYDDVDYLIYDYVPESYTGDEEVPLVVLLHGYTEDPMAPGATMGWATKAAEEGFILVVPDYINDLMSSGVVIDPVMQVVEEAQETYNIDKSRIYLTGFSMGGMSSMITSFANADVFAAAAPMGGMSDIRPFESDAEEYDLPVFLLCGTIDENNIIVDEDGNPTATAMNGNVYPYLAEFNGLSWGDPDYTINIWGYAGDEQDQVILQDYVYDIDYFYSDDYTYPIMELVSINGAAHCNSNVFSDLAWDFLSKFARGEDGSVIELDAE